MSGPMHGRKRFFVSLFFVVLFIVLIPFILLYSAGYRLGKGFSLLPTGGVYVFYPESGADVYVDGTLSKTTSLFERGIFIDNLNPRSYNLEVSKKGYRPWKKTVDVAEKKVAEAYPYLIPEVIATSSIPKFVTIASGASVSNPLYREVVSLFATTTATTTTKLLSKEMFAPSSTSAVVATTTVHNIRKDIEISLEDSKVVAYWKGRADSTPFYFCDTERLKCEASLEVLSGDIKKVDFYPGRNDVVIYSTKDGIYSTELDTRSPQNTFKLLSGNLDFREDDQRVFIRDKNNYYELLFTASTTLNSISI